MTPVNTTICYAITSPLRPQPFRVDISINDKPTNMEIDTGALVSERTLQDDWPEARVMPSNVRLHSYSAGSGYCECSY